MIDNNTLAKIKTDKSFREYYIRGLLMGLQSESKSLEQVYNEIMQIAGEQPANPYNDMLENLWGKR